MAKTKEVPPTTDKKRTTVTFPPDLYDSLASHSTPMNDMVVEAVRHWIDAGRLAGDNHVAKRVRDLWKAIVEAEDFKNPYQKLAVNWRAQRVVQQIEGIRSVRRLNLEAFSAEVYLMRVIEELMSDLKEGDVYCTVTNVPFWRGTSNERQGVNNADLFLRAQEAAVGRGMQLKRVFLILSDDNTELVKGEMKRQRCFQKRLEQIPNARAETGFYHVNHLGRDSAITEYGHFGLVRKESNGNECMVIQPIYQGEQIRNLEIIFSEGSGFQDHDTRKYINQFEGTWENKQNLKELPPEFEPE